MNTKDVMNAGRDALFSYVGFMCLFAGSGVSKDLSRKVSMVFAASAIACNLPSILKWPAKTKTPWQGGVGAATSGYVAFLFSGSERLALLTTLVSLVSSSVIGPLADAFIEYSANFGSYKPEIQKLTKSLIYGAQFGVLARVLGYSNKVALAATGLIAAENYLEKKAWSLWGKDVLDNPLDNAKLSGAVYAYNLAAGIALKSYLL